MISSALHKGIPLAIFCSSEKKNHSDEEKFKMYTVGGGVDDKPNHIA